MPFIDRLAWHWHSLNNLHITEGLSPFATEEKTKNDICYVENTWNSEKETGSTLEVENKQEQDRLKSIQEMGSTSGLENKQEQGRLKVTGSTSDVENKQEEGRLEPIQEAQSEVVAEEKTKNDTSEVEVVSTSQKVSDAVSSGCTHSSDLDLHRIVSEECRYHYGTLGVFASFRRETETSACALFPRHVNGENGQPIELGKIFEDTLQDRINAISAAKIHDHQVQHFHVQFKNSENVPLPGKLHTKASSIDLQDRKFYLWRAESAPRVRIIITPELSSPEMTETYMQIEDRNSYERMAVAGDSDAIFVQMI